ncbi:hypothetical protein B0H16DRAFT_1477783 [Mycena metata]|uniref:Uncharacterized protein n=1 Tax=Mycena metata TaxID=1033252 RepID=A0AAD7H8V9_9AGAR|nr:hypothetical protein B0H16DRAFT_1477783 [Mycena metata]
MLHPIQQIQLSQIFWFGFGVHSPRPYPILWRVGIQVYSVSFFTDGELRGSVEIRGMRADRVAIDYGWLIKSSARREDHLELERRSEVESELNELFIGRVFFDSIQPTQGFASGTVLQLRFPGEDCRYCLEFNNASIDSSRGPTQPPTLSEPWNETLTRMQEMHVELVPALGLGLDSTARGLGLILISQSLESGMKFEGKTVGLETNLRKDELGFESKLTLRRASSLPSSHKGPTEEGWEAPADGDAVRVGGYRAWACERQERTGLGRGLMQTRTSLVAGSCAWRKSGHRAAGIPLSGRVLHVCHYLPVQATLNRSHSTDDAPLTPPPETDSPVLEEKSDDVWTLVPRSGHAAMPQPVSSEGVTEEERTKLEEALVTYHLAESDPDDDHKDVSMPRAWCLLPSRVCLPTRLHDVRVASVSAGAITAASSAFFPGLIARDRALRPISGGAAQRAACPASLSDFLWPLFHYLLWQDITSQGTHYAAANEAFAERIKNASSSPPSPPAPTPPPPPPHDHPDAHDALVIGLFVPERRGVRWWCRKSGKGVWSWGGRVFGGRKGATAAFRKLAAYDEASMSMDALGPGRDAADDEHGAARELDRVLEASYAYRSLVPRAASTSSAAWPPSTSSASRFPTYSYKRHFISTCVRVCGMFWREGVFLVGRGGQGRGERRVRGTKRWRGGGGAGRDRMWAVYGTRRRGVRGDGASAARADEGRGLAGGGCEGAKPYADTAVYGTAHTRGDSACMVARVLP